MRLMEAHDGSTKEAAHSRRGCVPQGGVGAGLAAEAATAGL